jgi:hypothetical protein
MPNLGRITAPGHGNYTPPPTITLEVTPEMMRTLERMSRDSGQPLDVVFTRSIALYQAALRATAEGKHVGYSASPDVLEVEFTGLAGTEGR